MVPMVHVLLVYQVMVPVVHVLSVYQVMVPMENSYQSILKELKRRRIIRSWR